MAFKSDIEITQSVNMRSITEIANDIGISDDNLLLYGKYKAKVDIDLIKNIEFPGKLILITSINPTSAGEGKTTTAIGLADGLKLIGKKSALALSEPSLGSVLCTEGGTGYAQVVPSEDINLHFTGDMHAIGAANNLLAAMIDNHIYMGNKLNIDIKRIVWKRCTDINDRQLRNIVNGLNGKSNGLPREDGFITTTASEVMAVLCLSNDIDDLKDRLSRMIVGYNYDRETITVQDLNAQGAMTALLKDAINPNIVQTLEGTPVFIHGNSIANIAHGCNSILATKMAIKFSDYAITEAGFGADIGAEKFIDIKCRKAGFIPDVVVIVATIRALKHHGGVDTNELNEPNIDALRKGLPNLVKHIENITKVYGLPAVVAINRYNTDSKEELDIIRQCCEKYNVPVALSEVWSDGGKGGIELAQKVLGAIKKGKDNFNFAYENDMSIKDKIKAIVTRIYGGDGVIYEKGITKKINQLESYGYRKLPICIAKTQYSLSDDCEKLARPEEFMVTVKDVKISAGAGFIVIMIDDIITLQGMTRVPTVEGIDIDKSGIIKGLL